MTAVCRDLADILSTHTMMEAGVAADADPTTPAGTPATLKGGQVYYAALCRVQRRRCIFRVAIAFKHAVTLASLGPAYTLRHTAATWLMQNGTDPWQGAGYLGVSVATWLRVYGHHHPDHLRDAVIKMTAKPTASASPQKRAERKKTNVVKIQ